MRSPAAYVLGKTIPANLLGGEKAAVAKALSNITCPYPRRFVQLIQSAARAETLKKWQEEWSQNSGWTHTLLHKIQSRLDYAVDTTFYSAMALSGYSSFG